MVPNFVAADASNFRNALKRDTYEGAMAELSGTGQRISDNQVIDRLAKVAPGEGSAMAKAVAAKFGDLNQDLVYTPVQPCRILDTRNTAAGAIAANTTRSFVAINSSSYTGQGGSATNCGTLGLSATAVAINLTAVFPTAQGFGTIFPFGTAQPTASSVNYVAGAVVANGVIAQIPNPLSSFDFTIYTFAQSHYVADIVGFYSPPQATALDCATFSGTLTTVNAGAYASLPTLFCDANYTPVALSISAGQNVLVADSYISGNAGQIFVRSLSANAQNVTAKLMCCRVPGR